MLASIEDARAKGATVAAGGDWVGNRCQPTILTGVREGMTVFREETFGPVDAIYPVDGLEDGLALANDTNYGLSAAVWTRDIDKAIRAAAFANLQRLYGIADRHMNGRDHVIAGRRTVIDAYLFTFSSWAARAFPNRLGDFPHLKRFVANMLEVPGVASALADEGVSFEP